ncbi:STAS domain-containing protein [Longispora sp. K20-0274]|uniref:STAS domain-containing protein n=1 Tax=Longispora sp. K20-0274 TaxID=3088255 RepID=UPI003999A18E
MSAATVETRRHGAQVTVEVTGAVDIASHDLLFEALHQAVGDEGVQQVVVDLTATTLLDSGGIGVLVAANNAARTARVSFTLTGVSAPVRECLDAAGVWRMLAYETRRPAHTAPLRTTDVGFAFDPPAPGQDP